MGTLLLAALLSSPLDLAQGPQIWAEPYPLGPFGAAVASPQGGMPVDITEAELLGMPASGVMFSAHIRMIGVRPYALDGVTLRLAIGPTSGGMVSVRLVPSRPQPDATDARLRANGAIVAFERSPSDPPLPLLIIRKGMRLVVTLESIRSAAGEVMWTNPDAIELLWDALGRPAGRRQ